MRRLFFWGWTMSDNMYDDIKAMREEFDKQDAEQEPAPVGDAAVKAAQAKSNSASSPSETTAGEPPTPIETAKARIKEKDDEYASAHAEAIVEDDKQSFGESFKAARKAGKPTFDWRGKSYTTELAEGKPAKTAPVAKSSEANPTQPAQKSPQSAEAPSNTTNIAPKPAKATPASFKPIGATDNGSGFAKQAFGKKS